MSSRPTKSLPHVPLRPFRNPVHDVIFEGSAQATRVLKEALKQTQKEASIDLLQQFHPYPGRMHPAWAQVLLTHIKSEIDIRSREKKTDQSPVFLDPFCGSGTTVLEAARLGFEVYANDLNPVAYQVTWVKTQGLWSISSALVKQTSLLLEQVRLIKKTEKESRFNALKNFYPPHVLVRLITLLKAIENFEFDRSISKLEAAQIRGVWKVVFSTLVTKFSDRQSEVHQETKLIKTINPHTIYPFFEKKVLELLGAYQVYWGKNSKLKVFLEQEDLNNLRPPKFADCIVTSPPYPGVFDYAEHHHLRCLWLNWHDQQFKKMELVPRRQSQDLTIDFEQKLMRRLSEFAQSRATMVLIVGDYLRQDKPIKAASQLCEKAKNWGWNLEGLLSIKRGRFAGTNTSKYEHVIWLVRDIK